MFLPFPVTLPTEVFHTLTRGTRIERGLYKDDVDRLLCQIDY